MNIISDDYSVVKFDLLKAIDIINKSIDAEQVVTAYIRILDFYEEIQLRQELADVLKKLNELKKSKKLILAQTYFDNYLSLFDYNVELNGEYYFEIFNKQLFIVEQILGSATYDNQFISFNNEQDIYKILKTYLSENNPKTLNLLNKYIEKKSILKVDLPLYNGITSASTIFNNIYVKIRRKNNFEDLLTILHEMSHARMLEDFTKDVDNREFNKFICNNSYVEVYPRLQEKYFLKFLLDNKMFVSDVKNYLIKWLVFFKDILIKNIDKYSKTKKFDYLDIKDINGLLYSELLYLNDYSVSNNVCIRNTIKEKFYLKQFDLSNISVSSNENYEEIKRLIKL